MTSDNLSAGNITPAGSDLSRRFGTHNHKTWLRNVRNRLTAAPSIQFNLPTANRYWIGSGGGWWDYNTASLVCHFWDCTSWTFLGLDKLFFMWQSLSLQGTKTGIIQDKKVQLFTSGKRVEIANFFPSSHLHRYRHKHLVIICLYTKWKHCTFWLNDLELRQWLLKGKQMGVFGFY